MKKILLVTSTIMSLLFISCTGAEEKKNIKVGPVNEEKLVESQNEFAFKLFKEIDKGNEDIFISPYSISVLLSMVADGAKGETLEEMQEVLETLGYSNEEIRREYKKLIELTNTLDEGIRIDVANSVWVDNGFRPSGAYVGNSKEYFKSDVYSRDFKNQLTVTEINKWIEGKIQGKIEKMLDRLSPMDRMVLVNAIYFKGTWKEEFNKDLTYEGEFIKEDGSRVEVEYMRSTQKIGYLDEENLKIARLSYGKGEASMYIFLPKEGQSSEEFVANLDKKGFDNYISNMKYGVEVDIQIPKFEIEYGKKELNEYLKNMGMNRVFETSAQLDGIHKDVFLGSVDHKAVINVNEEGTEAAAVTTGLIRTVSFEKKDEFFANKPFFFVIRDEESKTILFIGTYRGQSKKEK